MKQLTQNFKDLEFKCKCCGKYIPNKTLPYVLEAIRERFHSAVIIVSGTRCAKHNKSCGGAANSQHLLGTAADIQVKGIKPETVYNFCDNFMISGGVGKYKTFTHIDIREVKARW